MNGSANRFYFDEHIPLAIPKALVRNGVDVLTVRDSGRVAISDIEQLAFASQQGRVMVTMDSDYIALAAQGTPHAGIAYAQPRKRSIGELVDALTLVYDVLAPERMADQVKYL